jgi:hypothetical protein
VPTLSADAFAALARSSPWRWTTLRFTVSWPGDSWRTEALRAWLHRPDSLRVETTDGVLLQIVREPRGRLHAGGLAGGWARPVRWPRNDAAPLARRRSDGLVAARPRDVGRAFDDPMYRDYFWVAMLDPAELADGTDPDSGDQVPPLVVENVSEVEHAGRPAWEATVRTTRAYVPRCGCCSLLRSRDLDVGESAAGSVNKVLARYPEAHRVRLDAGTGVCVLTEAVGGLSPGAGHDLRIEAVDETMRGDLFRGRR